jgi:hypothetical protein
VPPRSAAAFETTDAELERGVLDALAKGLDGVAKTLAEQLRARQAARAPANVVALDQSKRRGRLTPDVRALALCCS